MADVKLTKNELRDQQKQLKQLQRYLPTLQLKKAMLQAEVNEARQEIGRLEREFTALHARVGEWSELLSEQTAVDPNQAAVIVEVHKEYENIAGVDVPSFSSIDFAPLNYSLFEAPPWVDAIVRQLRGLVEARVRVEIAEEKKAALEKELREVSIRVNLFEKILIPRCKQNIKKIKVFLGDQELAAVSQAKVAKGKIEARKLAAVQELAHAN